MSHCGLDLIKLVELGKLEMGAVSSAGHFQSRNGRWFSQKKKSDESDGNAASSDAPLCIQQGSLIQVKCKRGNAESVENYRVLGLFSKYYSKWFVAPEDNFPWTNNPSAVKNARVLARLVKKTGSNYNEVELKTGGDWGPKHVFCVKNYCDILHVDSRLIDM